MSNDPLFDTEQDGSDNNAVDNKNVVVRRGTLNAAKDQITLRVKRSLLKSRGGAESGIYEIPIDFKVLTGDDHFNSNGRKYSNYMVSVTAAIYENSTSVNYSTSSYVDDYLIYTNAKLDPSVQ